MMDFGYTYLNTVLNNFRNIKSTSERAMEQLSFEELHWMPNEESNSVAVIIKHMAGNMISRWTDFLTSDGEKPNRNRDGEFEGEFSSRDELLQTWETGWTRLFETIESLTPADLLKTVYIRTEPHTVIQAIERQVYHLSYHAGQIVYLGKLIRNSEWETITIPRGESKKFLEEMTERFEKSEGVIKSIRLKNVLLSSIES